MSDRFAEKAECPFYLGLIRSKRLIGIECEGPDINLGFRTSHFVRFPSNRDLTDYAEIFCCDMYPTCPFYQAVLHIKYKS